MNDKIKITLISDEILLWSGLQVLIDSNLDMQVIANITDNIIDIKSLLHETDIVLLDIDSKNEISDVIRGIINTNPSIKVICLTNNHDAQHSRRAILAGAMGLVEKNRLPDILFRAIRKVVSGEVWLDRAMMASILNERLNANVTADQSTESIRIARLTEREREVIQLIGEGLRNRQIAERMYISESTVRNHLSSIFAKLGVSDRFELIIYAFQQRLARIPNLA